MQVEALRVNLSRFASKKQPDTNHVKFNRNTEPGDSYVVSEESLKKARQKNDCRPRTVLFIYVDTGSIMNLIHHQFGRMIGVNSQDETFMPRLKELAVTELVPESYLEGVYEDLRSVGNPFYPDLTFVYVQLLFAPAYKTFLGKCKELRTIRPDKERFVDDLIEKAGQYRINEAVDLINDLYVRSDETDPHFQILLILLLSRVLILKADPVFYQSAVELCEDAEEVYGSVDPELAEAFGKSRMFARLRTEILGYWIRLYPDRLMVRRYISEVGDLLRACPVDSETLSARENLLLQVKSALYVSGSRLVDTEIMKKVICVDEELLKLYELDEGNYKKAFSLRFTSMQFSVLIGILDYDAIRLEEALSSFDDIDTTQLAADFPQVSQVVDRIKSQILRYLQVVKNGEMLRVIHSPWLDTLVGKES